MANEVQFIKQVPLHPRDRMQRMIKNIDNDDGFNL